jgi:ribonuclease P protein component
VWPAVDLFRKGGLILQRLKSRRQFQAVLAASTLARTPHFALHCAALNAADVPSPEKPLFAPCDVWLGAMVPKRWAKKAVTRNAIKRQIYLLGHDFEHVLAQAAHVVRLRSSFDRSLFPSASSEALKATVRSELQQLFSRATAQTPRALSG